MKPYDHKKIEKKWQAYWEKKKLNVAKDSDEKKFFALIEFPYPSGQGMHTGHLRSNTAMDIIARKRRSEGFNVLYPIGWDAFGLPTENYAIKTGIAPAKVTKQNTDTFRKQLKSVGFSFDWSREINTSDPAYYKWTQWIFLKMFEKGLAYKKKQLINWCPKDKIGLANEEVVDGKCERCGTVVEKKEKDQWMLGITKYADRLDKDLDSVDYLPKIKIQQRNWIGKSEGAEFEFKIVSENTSHARSAGSSPASPPPTPVSEHGLVRARVFTTRADTLFGVTYIVFAPENELVQKLKPDIKNWPEVEKYVSEARKKDDTERGAEGKEKTGVELKGIKAINPANGEEVPVWIADYVLAQYGTGAVMAVPAHDERDFAFAKKYGLPVKQVIEPCFITTTGLDAFRQDAQFVERNPIMAIVKHWSEDKYIGLKWKQVDWQTLITGGPEGKQTPEEGAIIEITEETGYLHPRLIKKLSKVHSKFYHVPKKINRFAHFDVFYFELENGERNTVSTEEEKIHEVEWISREEMSKFLTPPAHLFSWNEFLNGNQVYTSDGILVDSGEFSKLDSEQAKKKITEKFGKSVTTYKLRDWVFSRQRYWGEPIPMVWCEQCAADRKQGWVPVPEKDLPVKLPEVKNYQPTDNGESPLAAISKWVNIKCPVCKGKARRETDTMPNWAGSSWYYLRYADPKNKKAFADFKKLEYWTPVDWYNGGMEHTTLHLLYSRFWHKFLFDIGLVPTSEPYMKRTSHGMILADGGEKMSKSKGNVVNPDSIIEAHGADTLRLYEMFMGPFDQSVAWSTDGIVGPRRFLERVWKLKEKVNITPSAKPDTPPNLGGDGDTSEGSASPLNLRGVPSPRGGVISVLHQTIKKVSEDIESMSFNTAVSSLMIFANECEKMPEISKETYGTFLKLLSPFAPHITEELWFALGNKKSIHLEPWPKFDSSKIVSESATIAVQVNGKIRAQFQVISGLPDSEIEKMAKSLPEVKKWTEGKEIRKVIVVKGRLVSIVVS